MGADEGGCSARLFRSIGSCIPGIPPLPGTGVGVPRHLHYARPTVRPTVLECPPVPGYALLDSGAGEKLERFGEVVLARPDPQALWRKRAGAAWEKADLVFVRESDRGGHWQASPQAHLLAREREPAWTLDLGQAKVWIRPTPFKHVGLFPEQSATWAFLERIRPALAIERPALLNLFAYTGASSLVATRLGFAVTHVDASKTSLAWARENAALSGIAEDAIRFVFDDALAFARREVRRSARYSGILLDPPHFGRGPRGETWQLEEHLAPLLEACSELLLPRGFLVLSTYAVGTSPLAFVNLLAELGAGEIDAGELALAEESSEIEAQPRLLSCGFCARFTRVIS